MQRWGTRTRDRARVESRRGRGPPERLAAHGGPRELGVPGSTQCRPAPKERQDRPRREARRRGRGAERQTRRRRRRRPERRLTSRQARRSDRGPRPRRWTRQWKGWGRCDAVRPGRWRSGRRRLGSRAPWAPSSRTSGGGVNPRRQRGRACASYAPQAEHASWRPRTPSAQCRRSGGSSPSQRARRGCPSLIRRARAECSTTRRPWRSWLNT
eukprot:6205503-Pleurochrysis_carterae.AAC.1